MPDAAAASDGSRYWGYIAVEDGILYGSVVDTGHVVKYAYRESDMNQLFSESTVLFALDAATGGPTLDVPCRSFHPAQCDCHR